MTKDIFKETIGDIDGDRVHIKKMNSKRPASSLKKWSIGLVCVFAGVALYANADIISAGLQDNKLTPEKPKPPATTPAQIQPKVKIKPKVKKEKVQPIVTPPKASFNYIVVNAPNGLNVRTGPSEGFNSVGKLKNGSCLKYAESSYKSGWQTFHLTIIGGRSENTDGIQVYLSEDYLQKTNRPDHRCSGTITLRQQYNYLGR